MMASGRRTWSLAGLPPSSTPPFSARLTKVTGEGEQLDIALTADTAEELAERLAAAGAAASGRMTANNEMILRAGAAFEERQRQVYEAAVAALRRELGLAATAPAVDEGSHADAGGQIHPAAHS